MAASNRPNILLLLSDQHRADAMGCAGHERVQTPHMDRLAAEGTHYRNCYCSTPLCMPQRVSLATGRFAHNTGVYTNSVGRLPADTPMISHALADVGYRNAFIGKLHMRQAGEPGTEACDRWLRDAGYEHAAPYPGKAWAMRMGEPHRYRQHLEAHGLADTLEADYHERCFSGKRRPWHAAPAALPEPHYMDRRIADEAVEYLRQVEADRPFFCWVNWGGPHDPWDAPDRFAAMYDPDDMDPPIHDPLDNAPEPLRRRRDRYTADMPDGAWRNVKAQYYGMISLIDDTIGDMLAALEQRGMLENTLVIYASDHGEMMFDHGMLTKWVMYEASAKVPMIVRWPNGESAGRTVDTPVSLLDLVPTLLDAAGADRDAHMPVLHGQPLEDAPQQPPEQPRPIFSEMDQTKMVRLGRWKYVTDPDWQIDQLFDVERDPHELNNLATDPQHHATIRECRDHLLTWMIQSQARPDPRRQ